MTTPPPSPLWVGPTHGRAPRLEALLTSLTSARHFLSSAIRELDAEGLAAVPAGCPNGIGSLLSHIAAAERLIQGITRDGQRLADLDDDVRRAFSFESDPLRGSSLQDYTERLEQVRHATLELFAERDDAWLATQRSFAGRPSNVHYLWHHILMDEARHTGQIVLLRKYLIAGADPDFDPYGGL